MQIILVHPRLSKARTITLSRGRLAAAGAALVLALLLASGLLSWATLRNADSLRAGLAGSWLGESIAAPSPGVNDDYVRQNIDALAVRLGQIQARLAGLDALGDRLVESVGWKISEGARPASAPRNFWVPRSRKEQQKSPGAAPASPAEPGAAASGSGGPYLPAAPGNSLGELGRQIERTSSLLERRLDQWSLLESDLLYQSVANKLVPTSEPLREPSVGSGFGWRTDPFTGKSAIHEGLDFNAPIGTPILAAGAGVVASAGRNQAYGLMVDIDHGSGVSTRYAHATTILVRPGDIVRQGQKIAEVGTTGRSTGPHLHFEVRVSGEPRDPMRYLRDMARGGSLARGPRR